MYLKLFLNTFKMAELLLELCVTELEDVTSDTESFYCSAQPVVQESPHPYADDSSVTGTVRIPGAYMLQVA